MPHSLDAAQGCKIRTFGTWEPRLTRHTQKVRHRIILVPSATRPKMLLTSSSVCTQKFEFFHWLTKNECAAEVKITKLYAFHFTSGPNGSTFAQLTQARFTKKKQNKW